MTRRSFWTCQQDKHPTHTHKSCWYKAVIFFSLLVLQILTWIVICNSYCSALNFIAIKVLFILILTIHTFTHLYTLSCVFISLVFHWMKAAHTQLYVWWANCRFSWPEMMFTISDCSCLCWWSIKSSSLHLQHQSATAAAVLTVSPLTHGAVEFRALKSKNWIISETLLLLISTVQCVHF